MKIVNWLETKGYLFCAPGLGVDVENKNTRFVLYRMGRRAGVPDLIVWVPGGTVGIEVKKPAKYIMSFKTGKVIQEEAPGRQSENQKDFEKRMNAISGHHYMVAYDLADVQEYFWLNHIKAV